MPSHLFTPSIVRFRRSRLVKVLGRILVLTLLAWSVPLDAAFPRGPRTGEALAATGPTLWVNASAAAACDGETPCFGSIQAAIDAARPGTRVVIQAGEYVEQLVVKKKNAGALASEADRIVIEADPDAPPGSVVLRARAARCEGGYAVELDRSQYVTLRGLSIVGAGVRGIGLRGGSRQNRGIHLERNRLARGGPRECNGGIDVGRGNPETVIANNLIYGNGRNGIRFRDGRGGSYYVVGNTIARNAHAGIQITRGAVAEIVNNVIVGNGVAPGAAEARTGVRRLRGAPGGPRNVRLLGNVICGNRGGELSGALLDAEDAGNVTPTGSEGPGVTGSLACAAALLFADQAGADRLLDTADDDFTLAPGSLAVDHGVDPRGVGFPIADAVLEADFAGAAARPRDGDGSGGAAFDAGALEGPGDAQPSATPSPTPTPGPTAPPTPSPTRTATSTPSPSATPVPNRGPTIVSTPITRVVVAVPEVEPPEPSFDFLELTPSDVGSTRQDVFSTLPTTDPTVFGFTGDDVRKVNFDTTPEGVPLASGTQLTSEYASVGVLMSSIPISSGVYGGAASPPNATFIGPIGGQQSFTFTVPVVAVGIINTSPDQDRIAFYSPSGELLFSIRDQDSAPGANFGVDRFVGARVTDSNLIGSIVFQNEAGNDEFDELIFEVSTAQLPRADYVYDCEATDPDLDTLAYSLLEGPTGMQIDPATGVVTWTPTSLDVGTHSVKIRVEDGRGGADEQAYELEIVEQPVVPNVIGGTRGEAEETLEAAGFALGDVTSRHDPQPAGTVLGQMPLGGSRAPAGTAVDVVLSLGPDPGPTPTPSPAPTANGAPVAVDDAYVARVGGPLAVAAPGVLANDGDPEGGALTAMLVDPPLVGTLTAFDPDGSFSYEPPAGFVPPSLSPEVRLRTPVSYSGFAQVADFDRDGTPDVVYSNFGRLEAIDGGSFHQASLWTFDPSITTRVNVSGCSFANNSTFAVGDVDDSGDVSLVLPVNCDETITGGAADRYAAINGSQVTSGKVAASWVTDRLTRPHPDAYANASAGAPADPPIPPSFAAASFTEPSLARLDATGGVKLLVRRLIGPFQASYLTRNAGGAIETRWAGCRAVTGLAADEGRQCRVTWIVDAAAGGVEQVLTAPNPSGEQDVGSWRPWRQNAPIAADLDGDGEVEIVSGSDVFRRVAGAWQLDWQTQYEPSSVAVADLDGDGKAEVVQHHTGAGGTRAPDDAGIFIYAHDGTVLRRIPPKDRTESTFGFVSIGDADGDGAPDILYTADGVLYVYRADGRLLWPFVIPDRPEPLGPFVPGAVAPFARSGETAPQVYDLDIDGRPEVILNAAARLYIFDGGTGAEEWSIDTEGIPFGPKSLALADFDTDGHVDVFAMAANRWNCSGFAGGPVPCLGNALVVSGANGDWAPGPKVFNQIHYRANAVDDAARILFAPGIRRDFRRAEQQGTVTDPRLREGTTFTYRASDGGASSGPATVFVEINPANSPPEITSLPPTAFLSVAPYTRPTYQITATDPDPGDVIRYELVSTTHPFGSGPGLGVNVDPDSGLVDFYVGPCGSFGGPCVFNGDVLVVVAAVDALGARDEQAFLLTISPFTVAVPDVVGLLLQPAIDALLAASLRARVLLEVFDAAPAGMVLAQSPVAGTSVPVGASVELTLSRGPAPTPTPAPSPTPGPSATPTPEPTPGAPLAAIVVEPAEQILLMGETQAYTATGVRTDGTGTDVTSSVTWASSAGAATIAAGGLATATAPGSTTINATLGGVTGSAELTVVAQVAGDATPPHAAITSPAASSEVTQPADVFGTATDATFVKYELEIAPVGETSFTRLALGSAPVTNGVLGKLDPTLLLNGPYTVRLRVFDAGGNVAEASAVYLVSREHKVGPFSISFVDLDVPLAGVPIQVMRTYDSRDKGRGDFGIGWRVDVQTMRVRTNRELGTGWTTQNVGLSVQLVPLDQHYVAVTLADGTVETFDLQLSPTSAPFSLDFTSVVGFAPRPGTLGQLEGLDNGSLLVVPGGAEVELWDDSTFRTYDPRRFRYTGKDGQQIVIDRLSGVESITDRNGNVVTFSPSSISHSAGVAVGLVRDGLGRITQITDPAGGVQTYAYDEAGDLVAHTSRAGDTTTFAYDREHGLVRIVDPTGAPVTRNEYDDAGRLVATTDAGGNRIEFTHDLGASREIVKDRLGNQTVIEYDAAGNVIREVDALGGVTSYTHDARGNVLTETDPLGRTATTTYDARNNPLTLTDFDGNTTAFTYDARSQVLMATDAEGRVTSYAYDARGNLAQETTPEGGTTVHTYDARGNRLSTTSATGGVTLFAYDAAGRRTSETDPLGNVTTVAYDANGNRTTETRTRTLAGGGTESVVARYAYGEGNRIVEKVDALGNRYASTYGSNGQIATATDPRGRTTRYEYDARGNLVRTIFADGTAQESVYDAEGREVAKRDRDGRLTSFEYDARGNLTGVVLPDGAETTTTYDAAGRVTSKTDENGHTTTYAYAPNRQIVTDPLGHSTTYDLDGSGRRIRMIDALGRETRHEYDSRGYLTRTTFADGSQVSLAYDLDGRRIAETDQAGRTTRYAYDAWGRLLEVEDALGGVTTYEYDELGSLVAQTDAEGRTTRLAYDAERRLVRRTRPGGAQEQLAYDANGNVTSRTTFAGEVIALTYDQDDRLIAKVVDGAPAVTFGYTASGLRTEAGGDSYEYDARGRLVRETKASGDVLSYTYDAVGNRLSMATPDGTTSYAYDAVNRLTSVTDASGTTSYSYDAVGNLISTSYPNGVSTMYAYDDLNRVVEMVNTGPGGVLSSSTYTLDPAGLRLQVVESGSAVPARTVGYAYDALYRLIAETIDEPGAANDLTITYAYDAVGNRTEMARNGVITSYAYDADDRLVSEVTDGATTTYSYDENGNLAGRTSAARSETFVFDAENRLVAAEVAGGDVSYAYDADGMRTSTTAGGSTTTFLTDKNRDLAQVVLERTGADSVAFTYGNDLVSRRPSNGGTSFYVYDGQLSTRQLVDASGAVTDTYAYDAFGRLLSSSGSTPNRYLYSGEQFDPNVGFYYLRARYYDATSGRFVGPDPLNGRLHEPASLHRYLYANANPVTFNDPTGKVSVGGLGQALVALTILGYVAYLAASVAVLALNAVYQKAFGTDGRTSAIPVREQDFRAEVLRLMKLLESLAAAGKNFVYLAPQWDSIYHNGNIGYNQSLFFWRGKLLTGSDLNYYFEGMIFFAANRPLSDLLLYIYGWKLIQYWSLPNGTALWAGEQGYEGTAAMCRDEVNQLFPIVCSQRLQFVTTETAAVSVYETDQPPGLQPAEKLPHVRVR